MSRKNLETEEMRLLISQAYDGIAWKRRCEQMNRSQVVAVYLSLKQSGKLNRKTYKSDKYYHQISIGEYMEGKDE